MRSSGNYFQKTCPIVDCPVEPGKTACRADVFKAPVSDGPRFCGRRTPCAVTCFPASKLTASRLPYPKDVWSVTRKQSIWPYKSSNHPSGPGTAIWGGGPVNSLPGNCTSAAMISSRTPSKLVLLHLRLRHVDCITAAKTRTESFDPCRAGRHGSPQNGQVTDCPAIGGWNSFFVARSLISPGQPGGVPDVG